MTKLYVGLDVSLETTSICIVDADGLVRLEVKVATDPQVVADALTRLTDPCERVGLEAGPLSQWLYFGLRDAGLPAICVETRHMKSAIVAMTQNKNDRNDARSIAQVVRAGWFKQVHVKSTESQELRTLLITREFLVNKIRDHENKIRGALWPDGLKVGKVATSVFEARVRELVAEHPRLKICMDALLRSREALRREMSRLHNELLRVVKGDELCRRFMTIPGVGPVTALAYKTTIDHPDRFRRSSDVGATSA